MVVNRKNFNDNNKKYQFLRDPVRGLKKRLKVPAKRSVSLADFIISAGESSPSSDNEEIDQAASHKEQAIEEGTRNMTNLTELDLSFNQLTSSLLSEDIFKILDLSYNGLKFFPDTLLHTPRRLTTLLLEGNQLTTVPKGLSASHKLEHLTLSGNPIEVINVENGFPKLEFLKSLQLSYMDKLTRIEAGGLAKLTALEEFHCNHNPKLKFIDPTAFSRREEGEESEQWPPLTKGILRAEEVEEEDGHDDDKDIHNILVLDIWDESIFQVKTLFENSNEVYREYITGKEKFVNMKERGKRPRITSVYRKGGGYSQGRKVDGREEIRECHKRWINGKGELWSGKRGGGLDRAVITTMCNLGLVCCTREPLPKYYRKENVLDVGTSIPTIQSWLEGIWLNNNELEYLDSHLVARWDKLEILDIQVNPWMCDCENQWMVSTLVKVIENKTPDLARGIMCGQPEEMRASFITDLEARNYQMRCLDADGAHPERDSMLLVGVLVGVLLATPITLAAVLLWRKRRHIFSNTSNNYSRALYTKADLHDDGAI
uniref:Uncharacterized protein n=1 Tax=Timema douglasi TaxID=61478 RepID=A0A7R8VK58_TIMDO|nr:unnamed protein product [Timema douglasi]